MAKKFIRTERFSDLTADEKKELFTHRVLDIAEVKHTVIEPLAAEFRKNSLRAFEDAVKKYDKFLPSTFILKEDDLKVAYERTLAHDSNTIEAFRKAAANITEFHEKQIQNGFETQIAGNTLGMRFIPFGSVALYVPGGKALYPSTALMGIIPARLAGVKNILLITPPNPETKRVADIVLACAYIAGATHVLQAGGAQAIFAAAFGIPELGILPVDFIYGPGNIFVASAKAYVAGENLCGIDSFAGPSEVVIIADETANPRFVAHDLMAQAEHDENAQAILITTSPRLAATVEDEIIDALKKRDEDEKRKAITLAAMERNGRILLVDTLNEAIEISNKYAPEHLEIQTAQNEILLAAVKAAGSVFVGDYAPVAAGDYYSGTNHILPTAGAARFSSGVSVFSFYRRITYQKLTHAGLFAGKDAISLMSKAEGLFAEHGYSVLTRFEEDSIVNPQKP
ncbi:MAG: Histidinol dehydrogenase [Turneriella sp.]|nr:Histidinol dehydrogenase [Turneriella sp.]